MFQRTKIYSGLLMAFGSIAVYAQDATPPVQRVEITGSSIKRVDAETALPIQTITRTQIDTLGVTNVEQLLQNVSANSAVGGTTTAQGAGAATYGLASASLRGLGGNRTLILVNGRRLANYATDGSQVDVNSIPLAAVERVEILKDGASGVYGSDAVAGVINFILRKDFQGVELSAYYGLPTTSGGGKSSKASIVFGFGDFNTDHFSALLSADFSKDSAIYGRQRSYANRSWDDNGLFEFSATPSGAIRSYDPSGTPGTLNSQGSSLGNPLSPGNCAANGSGYDPNFGTCRYNSSPYVPLVPDVTRVNVAGNFRARINDDNEFFTEAYVSHAKTVVTEQASPYSVAFLSGDTAFTKAGVDPAIVLNPSNPAYQSIVLPYLQANFPDQVGKPVTVSYRATDAGGRVHTDESTLYHLAAGFQGTVSGWDYDAVYSRNESNVSESTQAGYQSQLALVQLLSGNDAFNPFTTTQTPALTSQIQATNYVGPMVNSALTTDAIDAKVSREVFQLPGGAATVAVGVSFRKEEFNIQPSAAYISGDISGYGGQLLPLDVTRNSHSVFAEADLPILKSLEADLSVRNDHYPTATSTNPKLSLRFTPIKEVLFRGSVGTGFREATLPELYNQPTLNTSSNVIDPQIAGDGGNQYNELNSGSKTLKPEKSHQASLGIVLEPIKGLSASFDYWRIHISDAIQAYGAQSVVNNNNAGNPAYPNCPTVDDGTVPCVTRDSAGNITQIDTPLTNVGGVKTDGVDVDIRWQSIRSSLGTFGLELNGTYTHKFDETTADGVVQPSVGQSVDSLGNPLLAVQNGGILFRWRHELSGTWNYGPYGLVLTQNYQSGYKDNIRADAAVPTATSPAVPVHIGAFSTYDMQGSYTGVKGLTLRLGLKNIFNRQPPEAVTLYQYFQLGYDPSYYDPHGRFVYGSATYKF